MTQKHTPSPLEQEVLKREEIEERLKKTDFELRERTKELQCLYAISHLVEKPGVTLEDILQGVVEVIPGAWQYPEITRARLTLEGHEMRTAGFRDTPWKMSSPIMAHGSPVGALEICYEEVRPRADEGPFLKEKRGLIDAIAERLGRIIERKRAVAALRENERFSLAVLNSLTANIAVLDARGVIVHVNDAWMQFAGANGLNGGALGANYLSVCKMAEEEGAVGAREAFDGILSVLSGDTDQFSLEYPCHSPERQRWYLLRVTRFAIEGPIKAVVAHENITERILVEKELQSAHDSLEMRVAERTRDLRRISFRLLGAHEEERRRVALELHDGIGQTLSAVKFSLENALQEMSREGPDCNPLHLEPVIGLVGNAIEEVRRIQRNLRPSMLDDLGILATISWFCREFQTVYPDIAIEKDIPLVEESVPQHLKIVIFRIIQEAFNNISKHSGADLARVSLKRDDGKILLSIEDNGVGFDENAPESGKDFGNRLGLAGMKERAELSGGTFSLESAPGTGTTLRAAWSLS